MRLSSNKDINKIINRLLHKGWIFVGKNHHIRLDSPTGERLMFSSTTANQMAIRKLESLIRKIENKESHNALCESS